MSNEGKSEKAESMNPENIEMTDNSSAPVGEAPQENANDKAALQAVELAQKEILYMRAEFENYKKRIQREQEQSIKFANKAIVIDLLGIVDLLDRAIVHGQPLKTASEDGKNFVSGVEMTRHELSQMLQRFGVEFVGVAGEDFSPELHEAVTAAPGEGKEIVAEVLQKGCKLQGKLLKPARVVVGRK